MLAKINDGEPIGTDLERRGEGRKRQCNEGEKAAARQCNEGWNEAGFPNYKRLLRPTKSYSAKS